LIEELAVLAPLLEGDKQVRAEQLRGELTDRRKKFMTAIEAAQVLIDEDLSAAQLKLAGLRDEAPRWKRQELWQELDQRVHADMAAARAGLTQLGADHTIAEIVAFIAAHPASSEAASAQRRLVSLRSDQERRKAQLGELVETWTTARRDKKFERCWKVGLELLRLFPRESDQAGVVVPLRLDTGAAGSVLVVDGSEVATADDQGVVLWWRGGVNPRSMELKSAGFDSRVLSWRDLQTTWTYAAPLERAISWQLRGAGRVHRIIPLGAQWLAVSGADLIAFSSAGKTAWRRHTGTQDDINGTGIPGWAKLATAGDYLLAPKGAGGLVLMEHDGTTVLEVATPPIQATPALYQNELLGGDLRAACVAGVLHHGSLESELKSVPIKAISGPALVQSGVDRFLLVGSLDGRLVAIDDSQGTEAWSIDVMATDIGEIQSLGPQRFVTVLDGSRIVCISAEDGRGQISWEHPVKGQLHGMPQVDGQRVIITVGNQVLALESRLGQTKVLVDLPGPAAGPAVVYGDIVVACYHDAEGLTLIEYRGGRKSWQRKLTAPVTAMAAGEQLIIVGMADGQILALQP
ncbi:MAG: PQQ-binding-like beta-propeller repeat protein, partial [Planctomycetota bacterium]|nr:PQQ-binding-like beta-propeller repeat protein [Planctomycetota bacterium]